MEYESYAVVDSKIEAGVKYTVAKMSFGRRVELTQRIRGLAGQKEFLDAGSGPADKMDAALLASEIDRIYVLWGLKEISGLEVDGHPATPETFTASGPEDLFREALAAIRQQCGLSQDERKN